MPDHEGEPPEPRAGFVRSLEPVERALDLGCGDGRLSGLIRARALTIADVSAVALGRAARRVPEAARAELDPDAPLPFEDSSFELVVCSDVLEHVRDVQLLLSEARRVLRPGGALAVTTPTHGRADGLAIVARGFERSFDPLSPHLRFFTGRSLAGLLEAMGFEVRSMRRADGAVLALATR